VKIEQSFYKGLYSNEKFAQAIGRLTMSSARLESAIKAFIHQSSGKQPPEKDTLGTLVKRLIKEIGIDRTACEQLSFVLQ
jgi:hypothetical protein